jgi:NADH dehydrogenase FAD-containing subunit
MGAEKNLVLIGSGDAHVHVLSKLAAKPLKGVQVALVAPYQRQFYWGMVPDFVAGSYALEDCVVALQPSLKNSSVRWLPQSVVALDANAGSITLTDDSTIGFEYLSINSAPVQDRQQIEAVMPGARERGLFLRPLETFGALWPDVIALAQSRNLRVAVIGGGAAGFELAMAIRHRLQASSATLVSGTVEVDGNYPLSVQLRLRTALRRRHITVLPELAVGIAAGEVFLQSGARLACDVPVIATGAQAPAWLGNSGLSLDRNGFIAVDSFQRSTSHRQVFAAGDVSASVDCASVRSGVYAVRAGATLLKNLTAVLTGSKSSRDDPPHNSLTVLSCGDRYAIASWRNFAEQGRWLWWLKNWIDRSFIKRYRRDEASPVT